MATTNHTFVLPKELPLTVTCASCKKEKPLSEFGKNSHRKLYRKCIECRAYKTDRENKYIPTAKQRKVNEEYRGDMYKGQRDCFKKNVVYFIMAPDLGKLKIGFTSKAVKDRLRNMRGESPALLVVFATKDGGCNFEKSLHAKFSKYHSHYEWFNVSSEILDFIFKECDVFEYFDRKYLPSWYRLKDAA